MSGLDRRHIGRLDRETNCCRERGERGGGEGGAKSFDSEKAWSSEIIKYSLRYTFIYFPLNSDASYLDNDLFARCGEVFFAEKGDCMYICKNC
jgi:hypothetical protein